MLEISGLIYRNFIDNPLIQSRQLILLTHHLYFFNELLPKKDNLFIKLFRIKKLDLQSKIIPLNKKEILNSYTAFWQVIKDIKNSSHSYNKVLLLSTMRHILEYFFTFLEPHTSLHTILVRLSNIDPLMRPFNRYLSRGSHSDADTLVDTEHGSTEQYFKYFENVFKLSKQLEHYNNMMSKKIAH